jgi:hypothetical protein
MARGLQLTLQTRRPRSGLERSCFSDGCALLLSFDVCDGRGHGGLKTLIQVLAGTMQSRL